MMSNVTNNQSDNPVIFEPLSLLKNFREVLLSNSELQFLNRKQEKIKEPLDKLIKAFQDADSEIKDAEKEYEELDSKDQEVIERAKKKAEKGTSEYLDWHEVHEDARKLWQLLMSSAIIYLDPSSKGNSKIFEYLKDSSEFEDVLYGLEKYYRDHTLHSIWVYLMGVQLICEKGILSEVSKNLNWYLYNDIDADKKRYPYPDHLIKWANLREKVFVKQLQYYKDAAWCIMALCHDLGYSLAKLDKLNSRVFDVLKYFHLPDFNRVGYSLDIEHQYLVEQFLEIMAMDVRIVPGENYQDLEIKTFRGYFDDDEIFNASLEKLINDLDKNVILKDIEDKLKENNLTKHSSIDEIEKLYSDTENQNTIVHVFKDIEEQTQVKCYRDDSTYWRLCKALERKEHGILSAYLIYKTLGIFADTSIRGSSEEWGLEDQEVIYNIIRGDILFAIAQHEFAYTHIDQLGSLGELLIICDELEEFTRLGRKLLSRKYNDTAAETGISIKKIEIPENDCQVVGNFISLELTYKATHDEIKEFYHFFWRKLKRICTLYSLDQHRDQNERMYFPIREIKIKFQYGKNEFNSTMKLETSNVLVFKSELPQKINGEFKNDKNKDISKSEYPLECIDDNIYLKDEKDKDGKDVTLKNWLNIKD